MGPVGCFFVAAALDALWVMYTTAIVQKKVWKASLLSAALYASGMLVTVSVVDTPANILPACAGAFTGTWLVLQATDHDGA